VFVRGASIEHVIRCECLRSATTIVGDEATASRLLVELGWERHEDRWRCPLCSEGVPSSRAGKSEWGWSLEDPSSGVHAVAARSGDSPRERPTLPSPAKEGDE